MRFNCCWPLALAAAMFPCETLGQIDPERRRMLQLGYNQPLEGRAPIAAYGFYYYNRPGFLHTNWTLRLAVAPIYLDAELGISELIGPNTDMAFGFAGGGFFNTYSEIREGNYRRGESFTGHGGEISASLYHLFNPGWQVPLYGVARATVHRAVYEEERKTADTFMVPDDFNLYSFRTGLRLGGREPSLTTPLAFEFSLWHQSFFRDEHHAYGFNQDREVNSHAHLIWGRTFLKYTFENQQYFDAGFIVGTSINADRLSTYRLGGMLPFVSEFPLNIPGYYFQELSAEDFALMNAEYSIPVTPRKDWRVTFYGGGAWVDYLSGLEQSGKWHAGLGGGITYLSPRGAWFISLIYGHGFNALRDGKRGGNQVGLLFQYDFDATTRDRLRPYGPPISPYGSRAGERIFK